MLIFVFFNEFKLLFMINHQNGKKKPNIELTFCAQQCAILQSLYLSRIHHHQFDLICLL